MEDVRYFYLFVNDCIDQMICKRCEKLPFSRLYHNFETPYITRELRSYSFINWKYVEHTTAKAGEFSTMEYLLNTEVSEEEVKSGFPSTTWLFPCVSRWKAPKLFHKPNRCSPGTYLSRRDNKRKSKKYDGKNYVSSVWWSVRERRLDRWTISTLPFLVAAKINDPED